jgi:predicted HTH domain antitoxin
LRGNRHLPREAFSMGDISLTIPGDALATAKIPRHRLESELKKQLAVQLYREGLVSGAGACRIAGLAKAEFQHLLGEYGVAQQYDVEDYQKDLEHLAAWRASR